jgi:hypothetical protein
VKSILRVLALAIVIAAIGYWIGTGANRGWTKNQIPIKTLDDVTGIEGVTSYQKKFVPGVDFLAGAAVAGCLCFAVSFLFRTKPAPQSSNQQTAINK